jgi:hypothetical protein
MFLPSTHWPHNSGCDSDLDLAFLLDGSGSVTAQGFQQAKGIPPIRVFNIVNLILFIVYIQTLLPSCLLTLPSLPTARVSV